MGRSSMGSSAGGVSSGGQATPLDINTMKSPWARPSMLSNTATGRIRVGRDFQADIPELVTCPSPPPSTLPAPQPGHGAATGASRGGERVDRHVDAFTYDSRLPVMPLEAVAGVSDMVLSAQQIARCVPVPELTVSHTP